MISFDTIEPAFVKQFDGVDAFFTLRNEHLFGSSGLASSLKKTENFSDENADILIEDDVNIRRSELFSILDLDPLKTAWADQVHGNNVKNVEEGGLYDNVDGLITRKPGFALITQVADCAALLMYNPKARMIAAVHAGWRGAVAGIIPNTVKAIEQIGGEPSQTYAFLSPCISQEHFEVGEEVAVQFSDRFVDRNSYSKPHVNLKQFVAAQLREGGLPEDHIEIHPKCTFKDKNQLYSYRRENDKSGRMLAVIRLREHGNAHES